MIKLILSSMFGLGFLMSTHCYSRVENIEIIEISPIAENAEFGEAGAYEKLSGIAYFSIDPDHKRNKTITDLNNIHRDGTEVKFSAEFEILRPVDPSKSSGILFVETPAEGEKLSLGLLHDIDARHDLNIINEASNLGNGFLFNKGHAVLWIAWQGNIIKKDGRLTTDFPVARKDGETLRQYILTEFNGKSFRNENPRTLPLSGRSYIKPYSAISHNKAESNASLYFMPSGSNEFSSADVAKGELISDDQWAFAHCPSGWPGTPSIDHICIKNGFLKNRNYHLLYTAEDPIVMGLGYATTRDFISFLRNPIDSIDSPLLGITHVICMGIGQGARYLRDFFYQGFNVDTKNRKICDGANIHGAGVEKTYLNYRFSQPYRDSTQHSERFIPDVNFPRQYSVRVNPFLKFPDGILKRPAFDPNIFHTDTSTEYWQSRAALIGSSEGGTYDFTQSSKVRRFLIAGAQTYNRFNELPNYGFGDRQCVYPSNNLHIGLLMRALVTNLENWVVKGEEPLESIYPKIKDETLIEAEFLDLSPALLEHFRGSINGSGDMDFGPRVKFNRGAVDLLIPDVIAKHKVLVPKVDQVGNDLAGIRHPRIEVPTGTHLGWNVRTSEFGGGDLCNNTGSYVPLPLDDDQAISNSDTRPPLLSLYPEYSVYIEKLKTATYDLVNKKLLLPRDAEEFLQRVSETMFAH